MQIDVRDTARRQLGQAVLTVADRPTRVSVALEEGASREVFLTWDGAIDDAGSLKSCVVCGCTALFRTRSFPRITLLIVPLAFAGAIVAALGFAQNPWVLAALLTVLIVDLAILLFSRRQLVCYRCRSTYTDVPIARYHHDWDRLVAEKYPAPAPTSATHPVGA